MTGRAGRRNGIRGTGRTVWPLAAAGVLALAGCAPAPETGRGRVASNELVSGELGSRESGPTRPVTNGERTGGRSDRDEPDGVRRYSLRGQVVASEAGGKRLRIRHEEIPGFMPAMTMPFERRERAAAPVRVGESIEAELVVTKRASWLEALRVVEATPAAEGAAARPGIQFAPRRPGERLSDFALRDQTGRSLGLRDLRGKVVVLTFIYTRCPLPEYCPLMSERFAELQAQLLADPRLARRAVLLTVSFDPAYDTPTRLREYGRRFGADPRLWRLLTGDPEGVARLAGELGVAYAGSGGQIDHNLETAVIDGSGRLARRFPGNEWTVEELAAAVREVARR